MGRRVAAAVALERLGAVDARAGSLEEDLAFPSGGRSSTSWGSSTSGPLLRVITTDLIFLPPAALVRLLVAVACSFR